MEGSCGQETSIFLSRVGLHPFHLPYLKPTRFSETSPGSRYRYERANPYIFSMSKWARLRSPKNKSKNLRHIYPYVILLNFYHFQKKNVHFWHAPISSQHLTFQKLRNLTNLQTLRGQASLALAVRSFAQPALGREVLDTPGPPRTVRHLQTTQKTKTRRCQSLCYTCI